MSTLKVDAISNVAGTGSPNITEQAKAWVNFNGTGTVAIRADYNVSSITDNGVGIYTVNYTTAFPDTNYCITAGAYRATTEFGLAGFRGTATTTTTQLMVGGGSFNYLDLPNIFMVIHR